MLVTLAGVIINNLEFFFHKCVHYGQEMQLSNKKIYYSFNKKSIS